MQSDHNNFDNDIKQEKQTIADDNLGSDFVASDPAPFFSWTLLPIVNLKLEQIREKKVRLVECIWERSALSDITIDPGKEGGGVIVYIRYDRVVMYFP